MSRLRRISPLYLGIGLGFVILVAVILRQSLSRCQDEFGCVEVSPGDPIHIAYMLVTSGDSQGLGVDARRAIEIAVQDKGTLLGHPIKLTGEDTGCTVEGGQVAAEKIVTDKTIVALIGPSCSTEARRSIPIITQAGLTAVSPSTTEPFLTALARERDYAGFLRVSRNYALQSRAAAAFAYDVLGVRRAATLHDGSSYADALQQAFATAFQELGGTISSQESIYGPSDIDTVLTKIANDKPELLYYPVYPVAGLYITLQSREITELKNIFLMGADSMWWPDFVSTAGDAAEGMFLTQPPIVSGSGYPEFLRKYKTLYGEEPLSAFHAHAYDATMLVLAAIEKVAKRTSAGGLYIGRKTLRDALYSTHSFNGLTGTLTCSISGECADPTIIIDEIKAGQFEQTYTYAEPLEPVGSSTAAP